MRRALDRLLPLTRTRFAQPDAASAPAAPIQVAQSFLSAPKRPLFVNHLPFVANRRTIAPHNLPIPPKPRFRHPRRHFHLAPTPTPSVPYYPASPRQSHFDLWLIGPALPATVIPAKVADAPLACRYPVPETGCFATVVFILRLLDSGIRLWRTSSTFAGVTSL